MYLLSSSAVLCYVCSWKLQIMAEIVGTYILIYVGCGAGLINRVATLGAVGIGVVWGLVVMALVYTLGHISGAHLNPAVTISLALAGRFPMPHVSNCYHPCSKYIKIYMNIKLRISFLLLNS